MGFLKTCLISIYLFLSAIVTYLIYNHEKNYYKKKLYPKFSNPSEKVDIHKEFETFARKDKPINIIRLFIGVLLMFWIKLFFAVFTTISLMLILLFKLKKLKTPGVISKTERPSFKSQISFWTSLYLFGSGFLVNFHKEDNEKVEEIYKKYFGPDYKISFDEKYGSLICNHISFIEILLAMIYFGTGFISKSDVKKVPLFGSIAISLQSLFVDRANEENRQLILNQILERQQSFYNETYSTPLMIFPEGTTTSNRDLLAFKKGAFENLLPIKPLIIKGNSNPNYHVGCGNTDVFINYMRGLCEWCVIVEYIELPIMKPTQFMYDNYKDFGNEKWQIYSEVARSIYCEIGGFNKSALNFRDNNRYSTCMKIGKYVTEEEAKKIK